MLIVAVLILTIIVALPAVLIALDVRSKDRRWIEASRAWQTLIGALVGFLAAACMLILDSHLKSHQEQRKQHEQELTLLQSVASDADATRETLNALAELPESPQDDARRCMNLLEIYRDHPVRGIKVARRLDQIAGSISLEAYASISALDSELDLHSSVIRSVGQGDCASNPKRWIEFLHSASRDCSGKLTKLLQQNEKLMAELALNN